MFMKCQYCDKQAALFIVWHLSGGDEVICENHHMLIRQSFLEMDDFVAMVEGN